MNPISQQDKDYVLERTGSDIWNALRGRELFLSGGSGFMGTWLLSTLLWANRVYNLNIKVAVLTRDAERFSLAYPDLAASLNLQLIEGDIRTFTLQGTEDYIIHAAAESSSNLAVAAPDTMLDVLIRGTQQMLSVAVRAKAQRFLYVSSGAVYGEHSAPVPETCTNGPDLGLRESSYAEGKRVAEYLCHLHTGAGFQGTQVVIARPFTFYGPCLPLDSHYATASFMRQALRSTELNVQGPLKIRSYMYAADMAVHLWRLLVLGRTGEAYNVGSREETSMRALAQATVSTAAEVLGKDQAAITYTAQHGGPRQYYVPDTTKIRKELGLEGPDISLQEGLHRWVEALQ